MSTTLVCPNSASTLACPYPLHTYNHGSVMTNLLDAVPVLNTTDFVSLGRGLHP